MLQCSYVISLNKHWNNSLEIVQVLQKEELCVCEHLFAEHLKCQLFQRSQPPDFLYPIGPSALHHKGMCILLGVLMSQTGPLCLDMFDLVFCVCVHV